MNKYLLAATAALALSGSANAAELLLNGSFELPNIGTTNYTYPAGMLADWTYGGSALVNAAASSAWYGATPPAGQDGLQFAALQGTSTLSQTFVAGSGTAIVSWLAGGRPAFGGYNGNQNYTVSVGATTLGNYSTVSSQAFGANSAVVSGLTAGQSYTISFNGLVQADETAFIDKVSVLGVPEPASWALMLGGFGLAGFAARRRRRSMTVFA